MVGEFALVYSELVELYEDDIYICIWITFKLHTFTKLSNEGIAQILAPRLLRTELGGCSTQFIARLTLKILKGK